MKRTIDLLPLIRTTLHPESTVSYASQLIRDLKVPALAVLGSEPRCLTVEGAMKSQGLLVKEGAEQAPHLDAQTDLKEAASKLSQWKTSAAWVSSEGSFVGMVTIDMILDELAISRDAMTGLTWSDHLRDWGQERLAEGKELTILFLDLDRFGAYNKRYGHVYGDRILKLMADILLENRDPLRDVVVRYGGDEFVLASTRNRQDLEDLRAMLLEMQLQVDGIEEPITFSIGMAGGNRGRERTAVHMAAMLDNLINMASRDALSRKPKQPEAPVLVLHPSDAFNLALADFKASHPEKASQIADVQYQVIPDEGLVVNLLDDEGRRLSSAPLGQDLKASLKNALSHFAQAV